VGEEPKNTKAIKPPWSSINDSILSGLHYCSRTDAECISESERTAVDPSIM
jgi:hypothetical protein